MLEGVREGLQLLHVFPRQLRRIEGFELAAGCSIGKRKRDKSKYRKYLTSKYKIWKLLIFEVSTHFKLFDSIDVRRSFGVQDKNSRAAYSS